MTVSRRSLLLSSMAAAPLVSAAGLTAGEVIERIKKATGVPWRAETVDTLKTGTLSTPVTGIATTFMSTFDVLKRAVAEGKNMVITHEPTFYAHDDGTKPLEGNATLAAKQAFIAQNNIAIFRFHDHWHARRPDGIQTGMLKELGWEKFAKEGTRVLEMPVTTLGELAKSIKSRLGIRAVRVIGDPRLAVRTVALGAGYANLAGAVRALGNVDALVIGEAREWEVYEYVQDTITAGSKKGLIVMGHAVSEEGGMKECARWIGTFVSEVPVGHVPAGEPFWAVE